MNHFKVGDLVICIEGHDLKNLIKGAKYIVTAYPDPRRYFVNVRPVDEWMPLPVNGWLSEKFIHADMLQENITNIEDIP